MLNGSIRVKDSQKCSSASSKSGQFGMPFGKFTISRENFFRSTSPLPSSPAPIPKKPVSGGMASSGCESSMNLNNVVPERGQPTIIGIGGNKHVDELTIVFWATVGSGLLFSLLLAAGSRPVRLR